MTAIIYVLERDQVHLAMDTLIVSAEERTPLRFQTKFVVLPHLKMVVAGTGLAEMVTSWFQFLNTIVVRDIDQLNFHASEALKTIEAQCLDHHLSTTSIYHFGYSEEKKCYVGYVYRSEKSWLSEELQYDALGFKPVVPVPASENIKFPDYLIELMLKQQHSDQLLPSSQRLGIGGDITFVSMRDHSVTVTPVHRFETYEAEFRQMVTE